MKLYYVRPDYHTFLAKNDARVFYTESKQYRPFVKVILKIKNSPEEPFLVPLTSFKPERMRIPEVKWKVPFYDPSEPSTPLAFLFFCKMIPYRPDVVREINIEEAPPEKQELLTKELNYVKNNEKLISDQAFEVYKMRQFTRSNRRGEFFQCTPDFKSLNIYAKAYSPPKSK